MASPLPGYQAQVQSLLDDFGAVEYTVANLNTYINDARVQIAGASESIRGQATLSLAAAQQSALFTAATGLPTGVAGLLSVRMARVQVLVGPPAGWRRIEMRPWEYFFTFRLCQIINNPGLPTMAAQLNPGIGGSLYFDPVPDMPYTIGLDSVQYPIALTGAPTEIELIPAPWTEAIQYYAAYLALLNAQRYSDATMMFDRYQLFEWRATQMTTPSRLPRQYPGNTGATGASANMPLTGQPGGQR